MKQLLVLSAFAATSVFATSPVLIKSFSTGTVAPSFQHRTSCKVFANKIETTHEAGGVKATTSVPVNLSNNVEKLIAEAGTGKITRGPVLIGGGITSWRAFHLVDSVMTEVALKATGGQTLENDSEAVRPLVNLLDLLCK